jgi:membrane peptidoglycan carboxypeptidase
VQFGDWKPENYAGGYRGPMTVQDALVNSINTIAVKLGQEAGGPAIGDLARRFGITTLPSNPDLSVALGAYEVNLLQLTSGFQVFQQGGVRVEPYVIESIATQGGEPIFAHAAQAAPASVYDISKASMMVKMMKKVVEVGTAKRAAFGWPAAGKTGTSQNWRDAWFVGFTPDYVTGVWVGNDDDKPMNKVVGGDIPASIWRRFMLAAHEGLAVRDFPWLLPDPAPLSRPIPATASTRPCRPSSPARPRNWNRRQSLNRSDLVQASNTMRAGALKVRVTTSSRSDFRSIAVWLVIDFLPAFQILDNPVQRVEAVGPELSVALDPRRLFLQPALAERAGPHAADLPGGDEPRMLQHADVLPHARQGHVEPVGQFGDRGVRTSQLLQDATPGGVRERGERGVEAGC